MQGYVQFSSLVCHLFAQMSSGKLPVATYTVNMAVAKLLLVGYNIKINVHNTMSCTG
jgi:hypothetical protein